MTNIHKRLLESKMTEIEQARSWSPRVISKFETLIRGADDQSLYCINPLAFARDRAIAESESIDLFLHATRSGLFDMRWDVVCPQSGMVLDSFGALRTLKTHYRMVGDLVHQRYVLEHGEAGNEIVELKHKTNVLAPVPGQFGVVGTDEVVVAPSRFAAGRRVETAQDIEQGRLARAGRSEQHDKLALIDIEIDVLQRMDLNFAHGVGLGQIAGVKDHAAGYYWLWGWLSATMSYCWFCASVVTNNGLRCFQLEASQICFVGPG